MTAKMRNLLTIGTLFYLASEVLAHAHHNELTEEELNAPVDSILWIHMALQAAVWGVLFPVGMVLGISRSRWHVPLQVRILVYTCRSTRAADLVPPYIRRVQVSHSP